MGPSVQNQMNRDRHSLVRLISMKLLKQEMKRRPTALIGCRWIGASSQQQRDEFVAKITSSVKRSTYARMEVDPANVIAKPQFEFFVFSFRMGELQRKNVPYFHISFVPSQKP